MYAYIYDAYLDEQDVPDSDEEDEILAEIRKKQDELRYVVSFCCSVE